MRSEFVQILCSGHGHWITVSTINCNFGTVKVYNSLHPALTSGQIASIFYVPKVKKLLSSTKMTPSYILYTCV